MHEKKFIKWLGLSALIVVAVMAMNASSAQAYKLIRGGAEVSSLSLPLQMLESKILLLYLGAGLRCTGGTGSLLLQKEGATISGSGGVDITGCIVEECPTCTVKSPGAPAGQLEFEFEGTVEISGTEAFMNLESANFVAWLYEGALCPYAELEGIANGSMKLALPGANISQKSHAGSLDDIAMFYGEEEIELHGASSGTPMPFHATEASGNTWAIQS